MGRIITRRQLIQELEAELDSLDALLRVPEAMDALCAPDCFGPQYQTACEVRRRELRRLVRQAKRGSKCSA